MTQIKQLAIKLRKFNRVCPITGYKEESIKVNSAVIVQTDRGLEYGTIVAFERGVPKAALNDVRLKKVLRYATAQDLEKLATLPALEAKAAALAAAKVTEHALPVKIIAVEYLFEAGQILVYYKLAEGKKEKNLRELTRDLSASLAARVVLRQLSPRDEAKLLGGLGHCGRVLCCSVWLEKPRHVTVKMAKEQGLSISPTKTSGLCGRLMCCLEYEHNT